jgi:hypothetical protein
MLPVNFTLGIQMNLRRYDKAIHLTVFSFLAIGIAFLLSSCSCRPIHHEPQSDPAASIISLRIPNEVNSLDNIIKGQLVRQEDKATQQDMSHLFPSLQVYTLFRSQKASPYYGTEYSFWLFPYQQAADVEFFSRQHSEIDRHFYPIYRQGQTEGLSYLSTYILQLAADKEGFCWPYQTYIQKAQLRFRNLIVFLETRDQHRHSPLMEESIAYVTEVLVKEEIAVREQVGEKAAQPGAPANR